MPAQSLLTPAAPVNIYVDPPMRFGWILRHREVRSCHLFTDGPIEGLHTFAKSIGLERDWFQDERIPHYDLTESRRERAIAAGAIPLTRREAVAVWARIQECGQGAKRTILEATRDA